MQEIVPPELNDKRFDQVAALLFPEYSRSRLQAWIKNGSLTIKGQNLRAKDKLVTGQALALDVEVEDDIGWQAEDISLDIVDEDDDILVINKPVGLVVHPGAGHQEGTLLNALLHHCPSLASVPRAGIVHRLDKDTSGLMVVAKNLIAHNGLVVQLQARRVSRIYLAITHGVLTGGGSIAKAIGRHPRQRQKMAVLEIGGKEAITHYRVKQRFFAHTLVSCQLETGRTHQIRVHMAHIHAPLLGDTTYGGRFRLPKGASDELIEGLRGFPRQALHAHKLGLQHPCSSEYRQWQVPLPSDMENLLTLLKEDMKLRG